MHELRKKASQKLLETEINVGESLPIHCFFRIKINVVIMQLIKLSMEINPLVSKGRNVYPIAKISFLKRRDHGKISYGRRAYESVDDKSISWVYVSIFDGKRFRAPMG